MQVKLTGNDIYNILRGIMNMKGVSGSVKFTRAIVQNREILQKTFKIIKEELIEPSQEHKDYLISLKTLEDERQKEINEAKANKLPLPDTNAYMAKIEALEAKYKDVIDAYNKNEDKNKEAFEKEYTIEVHGISEKVVPNVSIEQMEAINVFIQD